MPVNPPVKSARGALLSFLQIYTSSQKNRMRLKRYSFREYIVFIFLAGYWIGGFFFFYWTFRYVHQFTVVGDLLLDRIWHFFFFVLWLMLIFSNAVVAYGTQYRCAEVPFLMSLPIPARVIFCKQFIESLVLSSWAFLFLALPMILAYGTLWKSSLTFVMWALLFILPFVLTAAVIGSLLAALFIYLRRLGGRWLITLLWILSMFILFRLLYFPATLRDSTDPQIIIFLEDFLTRFGFSKSFWMPSTWLASGTIFFIKGFDREGFLFLLMSWSYAVFLVDAILILSKKIYAHLWEKAQSSGQHRRRSGLSQFFLSLPFHAIFKKDILTFVRDPSQWIQLVVLSIMFCFYIVNLKNMKLYVDHPYWENAIFFMNITAIALFVSTLCLRFVFVQYSLEWKRQWLVALAPLSRRGFILVKYGTYLLLTLAISEFLSWLTNHFIGTSPPKMLLAGILIFHLNLGLVALALGIGVIYPFFGSDNPSQIMSGLGGIFALIALLTYTLLSITPISILYHLLSFERVTLIQCHMYLVLVMAIETLILTALLGFLLKVSEKNLWKESL